MTEKEMLGLIFRLAVIAACLLPESAGATAFQNGTLLIKGGCNSEDCILNAGSTAITGWTVLSGDVDECKCWQPPPAGGLGLDLDGDTPASFRQTFSTIAGKNYRVTFYLAGNPAQHVPYDIVKTLDITAGSFSDSFLYDISAHANSLGNMGYVSESFVFNAASTSTSLTFTSKDQSGSYTGPVIGNVAVTPLPTDGEFQIHAFSGSSINGDGGTPTAQLVPDANGNLFGTTQAGGTNQCSSGPGTTVSCGALFSLIPNSTATAWTEQVLYSFDSTAWMPAGRLSYFKGDGMLYGTALHGGTGCGGPGCGTVMRFTAPTNGASSSATMLFQFQGGNDGGLPNAHLVQDQTTGVIYGTTREGGTTGCGGVGCGVVFRLTPPVSGTIWSETVLHHFSGGNDGASPVDINMDSAGNLYGATSAGGALGNGVVFKLTLVTNGAWPFAVIHPFRGGSDGAIPASGVIIDKSGSLYGTTSQGGGSANCSGGCGTVFKLTPPVSGVAWPETVLHRFRGLSDGQNPQANLILDSAGALYGTTAGGGSQNCTGGCGTVFKLTPPASGTIWKETILHRFAGSQDGAAPMAGLHMDSAGHLTGTTAAGGASNLGTAFQVQ
jgi:choice-of-anchor C domain-containing protein